MPTRKRSKIIAKLSLLPNDCGSPDINETEFFIMRKFITAASALAFLALPVAANAAPNAAASLSVAKSTRAATPTAKKSKVAGAGLAIVAVAAVAVAGGLYMAIDGGNDSDSN